MTGCHCGFASRTCNACVELVGVFKCQSRRDQAVFTLSSNLAKERRTVARPVRDRAKRVAQVSQELGALCLHDAVVRIDGITGFDEVRDSPLGDVICADRIPADIHEAGIPADGIGNHAGFKVDPRRIQHHAVDILEQAQCPILVRDSVLEAEDGHGLRVGTSLADLPEGCFGVLRLHTQKDHIAGLDPGFTQVNRGGYMQDKCLFGRDK